MKIANCKLQNWMIVLFLSFIFHPLSFLKAQEQRELLFGTSTTPVSLDTLHGTTVDSARAASRQIIFLGPKTGAVTLYGKKRALTGSDTVVTVLTRMLGSRFDSPYIFSQYDTLGTIADGDTTFFFSVSRQTWWSYCDGVEYTFVMDTAGTRTIEIKAFTKIK